MAGPTANPVLPHLLLPKFVVLPYSRSSPLVASPIACAPPLRPRPVCPSSRSEFRERVHVLVNPNALHGLAIKDMLDDEYLQQVSFYDAVHINRCRFLHGTRGLVEGCGLGQGTRVWAGDAG